MKVLGGMRGLRLKDFTLGTYVKNEDATRKRVGLPKTHSGTDTHQWVLKESKRKLKKNNSTLSTETC